MARGWRPTELLFKLDIIMEENSQAPAEFAQSTDESSSTPQGMLLFSTTQTTTLPSVRHPIETEPQFLHGSRWPSVNVLDQAVGTAIRSLDNDSPAAGLVFFETSNRETVNRRMPDSANTDTWRTVTPDQVSMALDLWDPDDPGWPYPLATTLNAPDLTHTAPFRASTMTNRQSLFLREVMDEYLTRIQTVEHIKELDDNDNAVEIVSTLEQYRQNGWAEEMITAFPRECAFFWSRSGLDATNLRRDGEIAFKGFDSVVNGDRSEA